MRRKLVQMGKGCLMSAIPKKWLDQNNLKKGDYIDFNVSENYLILTSKPKTIEKTTKIKLKDTNRSAISRMLSILYDSGFTRIDIEYNKSETLSHILWSINILEQWKLEPISRNKCVIKTIQREEESIEVLFRRTILLQKEMMKEIAFYIEKSENLENIRIQYRIILSNIQLIKRLINTSILPLEYKHYYFIISQIESITNHYEYLLRSLEKNNKVNPKIIVLHKKLMKLYDDIYELIYSFDVEKFVNLHNEITIWKWFENITKTEEIYHLRAVSESMRNLIIYSVGIRIK